MVYLNNSRIFAFNLSMDMLRYMVQIIYSFIVPKLVLDSYGMEVTGLITSISQIMTYLMLVEAGLSKSVIVSLYEPLAKKEYLIVSRILSTSRKLYNKISVFFICLVIVSGFAYPFFINTQTLPYKIVFILYIIIGFSGAFEFLSVRKYSVLMQANKQSGILSAIIALHLAMQCIIVYVFIHFGFSVIIVEVLVTLSYIVRPFICFLYCRKRYAHLNTKVSPDKLSIGNQREAMFHQILSTIQPGISVVIATFLLPMETVGILSLYLIVVNGIFNMLSTLNTVTPIFGHMFAKGETTKFKCCFMQFDCISCFLISSMVAVLFATYEPFELLYSGSIIPFLALLCTARVFLRALRIPQEIILNTIGWYKGTRRYVAIQTVIMVGLSFLLGVKFGLLGIILGDVISQVYRNIEMVIHCTRKVDLPIWPIAKRRIICICCILIMYPILIILRHMMPELNGYGIWIIFSMLAFICTSLICLMIFIILDHKVCLDIFYERIVPILKHFIRILKSLQNRFSFK